MLYGLLGLVPRLILLVLLLRLLSLIVLVPLLMRRLFLLVPRLILLLLRLMLRLFTSAVAADTAGDLYRRASASAAIAAYTHPAPPALTA